MVRLIGREKEMGELESFLSDETVRGCAVYGIRQVGKTTMLRRIASAHRSVYIQAVKGSEKAIVERAMSYIRESYPVNDEPETLSGLLDVIRRICTESPTVVIIDEYPYMSSSLKHADSMMQGFIDGTIADTGSKIILCGSQMSSILDMVENEANPLYNRLRWTLHVDELSFQDTCLFHPGMDDLDLIRMYMVFGGMPLDHIDFTGRSFKDVIMRRFLADGLPLSNAARSRIGSELAETDVCESIVRAIAEGNTVLKDISEYTGVPSSTCSKHISRMEGLGILGKYNPMAGAPKRPRYRIEDGLVGLWYSVFDRLDEFSLPDGAELRYELVENGINTYMGHLFERFCAEYMVKHYACDAVGSWWGVEFDEEGERTGVDIDLIAKVRESGRRAVVYAECKFRNRMMKKSDLDRLERRARALDDRAVLVLFSSGGFERQLQAIAPSKGVVLIGLDELMGRVRAPRLLGGRP